ncbi:hypothetical protein F5Y08DRAFT_320122 [Xylaria arbuscula]|nr:hypothetical protein F5Y08DRAFT_320122 [Xylaria arbuscula]
MINRGGRGRIPFRRIPLSNPSHLQPPPELKNIHKPNPKECIEVKQTLAKATKFPTELIDIVMDFAEYWACSAASIDYSVTSRKQLGIHGGHSENQFLLRTEPLGLTTWHADDEKRWLEAAPTRALGKEYPRAELERFVEGPPSTLDHPCRKIVFEIVSRDQGWSHETESHGTYHSSWTWFDAGIDRFDKAHTPESNEDAGESEGKASDNAGNGPTTDSIRPIWPLLKDDLSAYQHPLLPPADHKIQCNCVAEHEWQHHRVEWLWTDNIRPETRAAEELEEMGRGSATGDGSFLRTLKFGDMVTIWGRARFPGWTNNVQKVRVEVYWAL